MPTAAAALRSQLQRARSTAPRPWRALALILVSVAHVAGVFALREWSRPRPAAASEQRIEVLLLAPDPPPMVAPPSRQPAPASADAHPTPGPSAPPAEVAPEWSAPHSTDPVALRERLYDADGRIADSARLLLDTEAASALGKRFGYEIPGLAQGDRVLRRPLPLAYRPTRFDSQWRPDEDLLTDLLRRGVENSTLTLRVRIPGMPGYRAVCKIVVLAASGGCGIAGPQRLVYGIDDPDSLDEDEQRACTQLWERLREAGTQAERLRLQRIYDLGCRLPIAAG